jgi:hypothetical protein
MRRLNWRLRRNHFLNPCVDHFQQTECERIEVEFAEQDSLQERSRQLQQQQTGQRRQEQEEQFATNVTETKSLLTTVEKLLNILHSQPPSSEGLCVIDTIVLSPSRAQCAPRRE